MKSFKERKKSIIALLTFILLIITSLFFNPNENKYSLILFIFSFIGSVISAFYSFIPIYHYYKLLENKNKNRLSDSTFTDRYDDMKHIVEKLITKEHSIEIKGNDEQCGKSWIAKKICDFINFSDNEEYKDLKENTKLKKQIKKAYYLDMHEKNETFINEFLQSHIINSKVLLIFDHVENLSFLMTKQQLYHFQLIYILDKNTHSENLYQHVLSRFNEENIPILQDKINKNHSKLENLTKKEIETLFNLTNGNIGKIYVILSRAEYINWIKDISNELKTDYDIKINEIQLNLYTGDYIKSRKLIYEFEDMYKEMYSKNNDLFFKIKLIESDCEHLLNNYEKALATLLPLKKKELNFANLNYNLELHEAHYNKHLWRSNEALIILRNIETQSFSGLVDSLGILTSKYFINDIYIPFSNESTLEVYRRNYIKAQESTLSKSDDEILKLHRHEAIYKYYFEKSSYDELINISSRVISSYKARNSRLLANAFFIRAEIHRIFKNYEQAIIDYQKCMYVTDDNNIKIQINVMLYYLDQIKKISSIKFPKYLSKEDIILLCKNKNKYGEILISKINSIELNDPEYNKIINIFDTRIMTIL
jgi:hypothetical protein